MSETSRYLALERRLRRSAGPGGPGWLRPADTDPDGWAGTADRLPPSEDTPTPLVRAASRSPVVLAFDDGAPIELVYDGDDVCPQPPAEGPAGSAPAATPAAPVARGGPDASAAPTNPAAPAAPDGPAAAPPAADLAAIDDDADFAQRLRQLVDHAGEPSAAASTPPPAAAAAAPTAPEPTPAAGPAAAEENRYEVFDRIGETLASPRTFDLGSVPVTAAFDAIERAMDRNQPARSARSASAPPPALDEVDLVEDLALMPTARAAAAPPWIGYTPGSPNTLVIGQRELPAPTGVTMRNWTAPGVTQFPSASTRAASDVRQIVIHETAKIPFGIDDPEAGVQLHLEQDGTLVQHNDLLDMLWHAKDRSPRSVGIEVVSLVFDTDAVANPGEPTPGERIPVAWSTKKLGHYLVVPPAEQLEALAQTVDALRLHLGVPDTWLQVMAHPDPERAAGDLKGRTFFLLTTRGHKYFTAAKDQSWIASHSVLRDHEDGAFPTLYCYLRLHKAMAPGDAYQKAKELVEDPGGRLRHTYDYGGDKDQLQLLDITDVA